MMDRDEQALDEMMAIVRKAITEVGFADFYFIGMDKFGHRSSAYCIGQDGPEFSWGNCERMDRIVGAMTRQIVGWQSREEIQRVQPDEDSPPA